MTDAADLLALDSAPKLWARGARVQIRVIAALLIRDAMARFGHGNLGFFWVLGEPMLLTLGVIGLWSITGMTHGSQVGVVPFALTGYSFITLWRHIVAKSIRCMSGNASLAFHHHIQFMDVLVTRAVLETLAVFSAFLVAWLPLALLGYVYRIRDPLLLVGGWMLHAWFCFAFGLILAALSEISEPVERFIQPALYVTLPFTGVFFMVDWLPAYAQRPIMWSPLVNASEMFRAGLFPESIATHFDALYVVGWCIVLTAIGLPLCRYAQRHVQYI